MTTYIFLIIGVAFFTIGIIKVINNYRLKKKGICTQGIISDIASKPNERGGYVFYPIVRFTNKENEVITEECATGFPFNLFKKGRNVKVIYDPLDNTRFLIDSVFFKFVDILLLIIGFTIICMGIYSITPLE